MSLLLVFLFRNPPFFHTSFQNEDNRLVNINNFDVNKKNICKKCVKDSRKRNRNKNHPRVAKWSG